MKAVLFDMDGVLIDSEIFYMEGTYKWMKEMGYKGTFQQVCNIVGTTLEVTYKMLADLMENRVSAEEVKNINEKYFQENPLEFKKIMKPYVLELMRILKNKGIKMAVCSASPKENIMEVVKTCGFDEFLDYIVSGEEFTHSKPHPEIYLTASRDLKVKIEECVVIEDSKIGIDAGKNAGMTVIAIEDDRFHQDQSRADYRCKTMQEVEKFLTSQFNI